jgi:hypothetical protein
MTARLRRFRVTTWLALAGYALLASGLPLPVGVLSPRGSAVTESRLAAKDRSRPFPCMDKPCGCATAEQCFANCCCHTPAERLAWAQVHGVEPAVLVALEHRVAAEVAPATPEPGGCCAAKATKKTTCCSAAARDEQETAPPTPSASPRLRTVTLQAMLACGGIVTQWLAVGGSLPPPRVELSLHTPFVEVCICGDQAAEGISAAPALPPPRAA